MKVHNRVAGGWLWPPVHPLVALYYFLDCLFGELLVLVSVILLVMSRYPLSFRKNSREPRLLFKQASIQAEMVIAQQLLLHKRAQWRRRADTSLLLQLRPWVERFIIHLVDDMVQIESRKGRYQGAVKAGLDAKHLVHKLGGGSLACSARLARVNLTSEMRSTKVGPVPTCLTVRGAVTSARATADLKQAFRRLQ
jgi:hypothetical protein